MIRPLPAPFRDVALLLARLIIGVVMFAHGYQDVVNGIGKTAETFAAWGVPLSIVSAAFVTVVEFVGSLLLLAGAFTAVVAVLILIIMVGAAAFVHLPNGIFVSDGGWELVGVIAAGLVAVAATGPGRFSVDHLVQASQERYRRALSDAIPASIPASTPTVALTVPAQAPPWRAARRTDDHDRLSVADARSPESARTGRATRRT